MNKRTIAIARAVAVIGGTSALIAGATFAAGNVGTVTLTGNTFAAIQGLQISNGTSTYGDSAGGFVFGNVAEGSATPQNVQNFWLEDTTGGSNALPIAMSATNCGAFTGLNPADVYVNIQAVGQSGVDKANLVALCNAGSTPLSLGSYNSPKVGGAGTEYNVWVSVDQGAFQPGAQMDTGSNHFDLDFTGTSS